TRPVERPLAGRDRPRLVPEAGDVLEGARHRGLEAHVDVLSATRPLAGKERAEDADGREDAGLVIGLQAEGAERRAGVVAVHEEHAARRLGDGVRGAPVAVGTTLAERRDRRDDEPRVRGAERLRPAAEGGQPAGRLALDEHVRIGGEAAQQGGAGRPRDVERDAALARVVEPEEEAPLGVREPLPEGRDGAQRAAARRLDEHDVGAEVGQQLAGERALLVGEVEDAETGERARHQRRTKTSAAASSVSRDTLVTRSESSRSVSNELGPTSISTEKSENWRRFFSARKCAAHPGETRHSPSVMSTMSPRR